jgi:ribose/xylose/arabinose/galactoside ABC-type transport system permease subunit
MTTIQQTGQLRRTFRLPGRFLSGRSASLLGAIVVMVIYLGTQNSHFLTRVNIINLLQQMTPVGIAALGTTLLIVAGYVDLSIGSLFGLAAVVAALLSRIVHPAVAIALAIALTGAVGLTNGLLVWRIRISPIIVTLGSLTVVRAVVLLLTQGESVADVPPSFGALGQARPLDIPSSIYIMLIGAFLTGIVLARTTTGRYLYAIGSHREAAEMAGLPVRTLVLGAFLFNGAIVGLAGVLTASRFDAADPSYGVMFELDVLTAVILGGVAFNGGEGSIGGALLGVAFITIVNSALVVLGINAYYGDIIKGGALILAVGLDQLVLEQRERHRRIVAMREEAQLGTTEDDVALEVVSKPREPHESRQEESENAAVD